MRILSSVLIMGMVILGGCSKQYVNSGQNAEYSYPISMENLQANMEFLTSDEMEGRESGKRGEDLAALYIKSELKKDGIGFLPELGNMYQAFDLSITRFDTTSYVRLIDSEGKELTALKYSQDFIGLSRPFDPVDTTCGLVFAGYGIDAPEFKYNDYDSINVKGKIVIAWRGEPESTDSTYFAGEADTRYSSLYSKASTARKQGAFGIMLVSKSEATDGWDSLVKTDRSGQAHLAYEDPAKSRHGRSLPRITLKTSSLEKILSYSDYPYQTIESLIASGKQIPRFPLEVSALVNWHFVSDSSVTVQNVIGYLPGNDPVLKNEVVGIGCHYDHVGIRNGSVYPGADDNGSGTVAVMEVAKALAINKNNKRSIVFIFHTAEEKGLLGSKYLTQNLGVVENMVSYINLDMIGRGATDSIYSIGSDKLSTELHDIVEEINRRSVNMAFDYKFDDDNDPERLYYRSDHYQYALKNIPVVFFFDWMNEDYHQPTDTADKINFRKLANLSELSYQIMLDLANRDEKPLLDKPISMN